MIRKESLPNNPVLQSVLRELVQEEFDSYSEDVEFSEAYKKKKEKIIRMQERPYWKYVNTIGQKIAVILISLVVLSSYIITVYGAWKPVISYMKKSYTIFTDFIFKQSDLDNFIPDTINRVYTLQIIPDDFIPSYSSIQKHSATQIWTNSKGDILTLSQYTDDSLLSLNTENAQEQIFVISQYKGIMYKHDNLHILFWTTDQYYFVLDFESENPSSLDLVELASNLVPMEPTV